MTARDARLALLLFGLATCLYALSAGGHFYSSDAQQKFAVLTALLEDGTAAIDGGWVQGRMGLRYAWFPLGASLVMAPGYAVGHALASWLPHLPAHDVERLVISFQNAAVTAALVAAMFLTGRLVGYRVGPAVGAALALGFTTMAWPYAKTSWSEPPATLALLLALVGSWWATRPERSGQAAAWGWLVAGAGLGLAVLVRQELAFVLPGGLAWLWYERGRRRTVPLAAAVTAACPVLIALTLHAVYEYARYGTWMSLPNYHLPIAAVASAHEPPTLLEMLYRYVLSPNQGLLVFSPGIVAGLAGLGRWRRQAGALALLLAWTLLPLFAFYVVAWGPSTWAWGMRYAYVFLPFLMLPAAACFESSLSWWVRGALGLGFSVQLLAIPYDFVYLYQRELATSPGARIQLITTDPTRSPLVLAARALPELAWGSHSAWRPPVAREPVTEALRRARADMVPDFWWALYRRAPIPHGVLTLLALTFAALGLLCSVLLGRDLRRGESPGLTATSDEARV